MAAGSQATGQGLGDDAGRFRYKSPAQRFGGRGVGQVCGKTNRLRLAARMERLVRRPVRLRIRDGRSNMTPNAWTATLSGTDQRQWLRHYFKIYDKESWKEGAGQQTQLNIDPYSSRLITDFLAYNTTRFGPRDEVYGRDGRLRSDKSLRRTGL